MHRPTYLYSKTCEINVMLALIAVLKSRLGLLGLVGFCIGSVAGIRGMGEKCTVIRDTRLHASDFTAQPTQLGEDWFTKAKYLNP